MKCHAGCIIPSFAAATARDPVEARGPWHTAIVAPTNKQKWTWQNTELQQNSFLLFLYMQIYSVSVTKSHYSVLL